MIDMWFYFLNFIKRFFKTNKVGNETKDLIRDLEKDKSSISCLIEPWLDKNENSNDSQKNKKKKHKEIIDIGNFINSYDTSLKIENPLDESPDVILSKGKSNIGVELMDLIILENEKQKEGDLKKILNRIEVELNNKREQNLNGLYEVGLYNEKVSLKNDIKKAIREEIINSIHNKEQVTEYVNITKVCPHSSINLYISSPIHSGSLKRETVEKKIEKKEGKLSSYSNKGLEQIWLVLVLNSSQNSSSYSFFESNISTIPYKSNFDRIFIFDFFERKTIELKVTPYAPSSKPH